MVTLLLALAGCPGGEVPEDTAVPADGRDSPATGVDWWADWDGDGFGDPWSDTVAVEAPAGFVDNALDCDDTRADVFPGAPEACDGNDQDCDGAVDEDATDAATWWPDGDQDGYGDAAAPVAACEAPAGHLADATDCDDSDADAFPGAEETCGDGVDQDCDAADAACPPGGSLASADARWAGEDGWGAGATLDVLGDMDGDGGVDVLVGAEGADGTVSGDLALLLDAPAWGRSWLDDDASVRGVWAVLEGGDFDGDGRPEALLRADTLYVFHDLRADAELAEDADAWLAPGSYQYVHGGRHAGDVDGDGIGDLLVSLSGYVGYGRNPFTLAVLPGPLSGAVPLDGVAGWTLIGEDPYVDTFAAGDLDGDGLPEVAGGVPGDEVDGTGRVYLFGGPPAAGGSFDDAYAVLRGTGADFPCGSALASGGDLDGDGAEDLVVAASGAGDGAGGVWLVTGEVSGEVTLDELGTSWRGEAAADYAGAAVEVADLDGDGAADLAVGATGWSDADAHGSIYVVYGPLAEGAHTLDDAVVRWEGEDWGDEAGAALDAGDLDGDGIAELLIGAPSWTGGAEGGAVYVIAGGGR